MSAVRFGTRGRMVAGFRSHWSLRTFCLGLGRSRIDAEGPIVHLGHDGLNLVEAETHDLAMEHAVRIGRAVVVGSPERFVHALDALRTGREQHLGPDRGTAHRSAILGTRRIEHDDLIEIGLLLAGKCADDAQCRADTIRSAGPVGLHMHADPALPAVVELQRPQRRAFETRGGGLRKVRCKPVTPDIDGSAAGGGRNGKGRGEDHNEPLRRTQFTQDSLHRRLRCGRKYKKRQNGLEDRRTPFRKV